MVKALLLFPGLYQFSLGVYLIVLSDKKGGIKYDFCVSSMIRPGIEPVCPGPLANTLPTNQIYILNENLPL